MIALLDESSSRINNVHMTSLLIGENKTQNVHQERERTNCLCYHIAAKLKKLVNMQSFSKYLRSSENKHKLLHSMQYDLCKVKETHNTVFTYLFTYFPF